MIDEHIPDIVAVTETWLDASIFDPELTRQGYVTFRNDRYIDYCAPNTYRNKNRSGVLVMAKSELNATLYSRAEGDAEILWMHPHPHALPPPPEWLYRVCHRPEVEVEAMLTYINQSINRIDIENAVLRGDFNSRNIDWQETCTRTIEQTFIDNKNDNLLTQIVTEPMRGVNILDLASVAGHSQVIPCFTIPSLDSVTTDRQDGKKLPVQGIPNQDKFSYIVKETTKR